MSFVHSASGVRRRRDLQTPAAVPNNPRAQMAERLPRFVQPFLTAQLYWSRNVFIIAGGQADPPITVRLKDENLRLFWTT